MKVAINSKTSGQFRFEKLNGRDHIVTNMIPIVGDIVMNGGLYPDAEVAKTFNQLDQLPAPNGHPKVAGRNISAFHPLAVNAYNTGGFIRNPVKTEKVVNAEFWVDLGIANQSDDGIETVRRIQAGDTIGVSTGLQLTREETNGQNDGHDYSWIGTDYRFDHVAILLNEEPAGGDVTKVINEDDDLEIIEIDTTNAFSVRNIKEQLSDLLNENRSVDAPFSFIDDVIIENELGGNVIYETGEKHFMTSFTVTDDVVSLGIAVIEVRKSVEFVPVNNQSEGEMPPKDKTNSPDDKDETNTLNVENAIALLEGKGMVINTKQESDSLTFFVENEDKIKALLNAEETRLGDLRKEVVANSDLSDEDVANMSEDMLTRLKTSFVKTNNIARGGGNLENNSQEGDGEFLESYAPNYNEKEEAA